MPTVKCQTCGKEFERKQSAIDKVKNHYCSMECSATRPRKIETKVCPYCNKEFEIKNSIRKRIFCSNHCARMGTTTRYEVNCDVCGNVFVVNQFRHDHNARFCSMACTKKARKMGLVNNNPHTTSTDQSCKTCGKTFLAKQSNIKNEKSKYCSQQCYHKSLTLIRGRNHRSFKEKHTIFCLYCGKQMNVIPSVVNRTKFCSRECGGAYQVSTHHTNTKIEVAIAKLLSDMSIAFEPQKRIAHYVCDFYVPSANLVIEADGDYWHSLPKNQIRDRRKTTYLLNGGYRLLRLPEHKINKDIKWCQRQIKKAIKEGPWQSPIW